MKRKPGRLARTKRKLELKRDSLSQFLATKNVEISDPLDFVKVLRAAKEYFGMPNFRESYNSLVGLHSAFSTLLNKTQDGNYSIKGRILRKDPQRPKNHNSELYERARRFYASYDWRRLRYEILLTFGFRCLACGRSPKEGAIIHVDHIKPLRKHWGLRLDRDNLQPLCDICNHGKGNWDETDFTVGLRKSVRQPRPSLKDYIAKKEKLNV